ncbi:MAG: VOC family protein [Myxococcota bacterium]
MNTTVKPFLMFEGQAEEAMNFYVATIPNSKVINVTRHGAGGPGVEGTIMFATFSLGDLQVMCSDSPPGLHAFTFTPSTSLFVTCASEAEITALSGALSEGGEFLMPLENYGFSQRFAWVKDRFGVSWQLNLE